jgi:hypothetical protein
MKRIASFIFVMTFLMTVLCISSCKKTKQDATPSDALTSECNEAQSLWDDVQKISEDALTNNSESRTEDLAVNINCATVTTGVASGIFIGQFTIDFGTGTVCSDGKTRSGQIIVNYTNKYRIAGAIFQSTTNNYFVNGKQIVGCRTVTNLGSSSGLYEFNVTDSALPDSSGYAQIIYPNSGGTTTWKSVRKRTWTAGSTTTSLDDDVYTISGTASGVSKESKSYDIVLTNLIIKLDCFLTYYIYMPSGGTIDITTTEGVRSVNYGNGISCDRNVIFTAIGGKEYELSL